MENEKIKKKLDFIKNNDPEEIPDTQKSII